MNLQALLHELKTKSYQPLPVQRVEIPKGDGGVRLPGIPSVRDRIVQQAMVSLLTPIFDPQFHAQSYGYRPKQSAHQALVTGMRYLREEHRHHVVDMDLSKCFDRLDHRLILQSVRQRLTDGSFIKLIRHLLNSGVMVGNSWEQTTQGSPQGGVISPLLANIYLDAFDQEMKARGHELVRYADDILIFCRSRSAAENAMEVATQVLEKKLKLKVNQQKSHIAHSDRGVKYLGCVLYSTHLGINPAKVKTFKQKVKALTRRNAGRSMNQNIDTLNRLIRGFGGYFKLCREPHLFKALDAWIRRRLRSIQLRHWKRPSRLHRRAPTGLQRAIPMDPRETLKECL